MSVWSLDARWRGDSPSSLDDASVAPAVSSRRAFLLCVAALAIPVAGGVVAYIYQLTQGLSVTGLNDEVFWGVYTVDLVTFIGFSYGGALVSAILRLTNASWRAPISRIAEATAVVTLIIGALFPIIHIGRPERLWEMFVRPQINSPQLWDMVAIGTYLLATLVLFSLPLIPDLARLREGNGIGGWRARLYRWGSFGWRGTEVQRRTLNRALTIVAIAIIPLAIMVHTVLSYAFSLTSRPGWHSTIFGPYFVIAAVYSGIAIVILASVAYRRVYRLEKWIDERSIRFLAYLMVAMGVAYAYFMFTEVTTAGYVGGREEAPVLYGLMLDRYAPLFWGFVVMGLVVPVLLVAFRKTRTIAGITIAAGLVVGAMWLKRFLIIVPTLAPSLLGDSYGSYTPSWVELMVTVGAAAAIPLLLVLLFRVVPVLSADEIEELNDQVRS